MLLELYVGGAVIFYMAAFLYRLMSYGRLSQDYEFMGLPGWQASRDTAVGLLTKDLVFSLAWPGMLLLIIVTVMLV